MSLQLLISWVRKRLSLEASQTSQQVEDPVRKMRYRTAQKGQQVEDPVRKTRYRTAQKGLRLTCNCRSTKTCSTLGFYRQNSYITPTFNHIGEL